MKANSRPFVFLNVATSLDGKLAPANRHFIPFGSKRDQKLLMQLRTRADAVMAGARTVDSCAVNLGPGGAQYRRQRVEEGRREYNLRVIVSGAGTVALDAEVFRHRFSPIIILTTGRITEHNLRALRKVADQVKIFGETELDLAGALRWLRKEWKVKTLLCEGGGEINGALFRKGLVDEVYLTLTPLVFGGRDAPTMADEIGISDVRKATRLRMISCERVGDELFLVYRVR